MANGRNNTPSRHQRHVEHVEHVEHEEHLRHEGRSNQTSDTVIPVSPPRKASAPRSPSLGEQFVQRNTQLGGQTTGDGGLARLLYGPVTAQPYRRTPRMMNRGPQ